jgi:transcriptional regulator with XRE-family HTH domain
MTSFASRSVHDLGDYLREQRQSAQLSLRQLSAVAGISNPYLSQIERGLKKPSAEILQALAKALRISAESLYVRAGILEERTDRDSTQGDVRAAILAEPRLTDRQRGVLLDVYESFVGEPPPTSTTATAPAATTTATPTASRPRKPRLVPTQQTSSNPTKQTSSNPTKQTSSNPTKQTSSNPTKQINTKENQL